MCAPACSPDPAVLLLPDDYDLIVTWTEQGGASASEVRHRPPGSALDLHLAPGDRVFAYRSAALLAAGQPAASLDRTAVRALEGCGPSLPSPERAFTVFADGEIGDTTDQPMPSIEAVALPCAVSGEPTFATPHQLNAGCATSSASERGGCTLCFDLTGCDVTGGGHPECEAPFLPLRTRLDGSICDAPPPRVSACAGAERLEGTDAVLSCRRPTGEVVNVDLVRRQGTPRLVVNRFEVAAGPDYSGERYDDAPIQIFSGLLSDVIVRGGQLIVARVAAAGSFHLCDGSSTGSLGFVSFEGELRSARTIDRPCLVRLAPDPMDPAGFLAGHLVSEERIARVVRYDGLGQERELVGEQPMVPIIPGATHLDQLSSVVVTGTGSAALVTVFATTDEPARLSTAWATWSRATGSWVRVAGGWLDQAYYAFAVPMNQGPLPAAIAISDNAGSRVVMFDPRSGPTLSLLRAGRPGEMASGPLITLPPGNRWLVASGGGAAGALTLFDRQGEHAIAPYFAGNQAGVIDIIEIAPGVVLAAIFDWNSDSPRSELALARVSGGRVWFEPRVLPVGHGIVGRFTRGELCPDAARTRVVWALSPWAGDLLRIELPCD
ncbi:MAG: hypothetical protein IT384_23835 [Deltaproteobacteria bacterium]|nr:hypothetical protein [Deltaproteobacteria bacterium]